MCVQLDYEGKAPGITPVEELRESSVFDTCYWTLDTCGFVMVFGKAAASTLGSSGLGLHAAYQHTYSSSSSVCRYGRKDTGTSTSTVSTCIHSTKHDPCCRKMTERNLIKLHIRLYFNRFLKGVFDRDLLLGVIGLLFVVQSLPRQKGSTIPVPAL